MTLRRRVDRATERAQARGTDDASLRAAWYRTYPLTPAQTDEARRKLAAMIERAAEAAEAGDQVAVCRLSSIFAVLARAERERTDRPPDARPVEELESDRGPLLRGRRPARQGRTLRLGEAAAVTVRRRLDRLAGRLAHRHGPDRDDLEVRLARVHELFTLARARRARRKVHA